MKERKAIPLKKIVQRITEERKGRFDEKKNEEKKE